MSSSDYLRALGALETAENQFLWEPCPQAFRGKDSELRSFENIAGVGISEGDECGLILAFFVVKKEELKSIAPESRIPEKYEGLSTKVIESGEFGALVERSRHRPAPSGVSLGVTRDSSQVGTLGFVAHRWNEFFVVSNNHVLACENEGIKGDAVLQPAQLDGGKNADQIGELDSWIDLSFDGRDSPVDVALARVDRSLVSGTICAESIQIDKPRRPRRRMRVRAHARTSGATLGEIAATDSTIRCRYRRGWVVLSRQIVVKGYGAPFSQLGDSGALVLEDETCRSIGMLCAGTPRFSLVTPISRVLEATGVTLLR
ncbi:hypothetical protein OG848_27960 [Streptomyces canus]|uniref:hypothetical protein n=1 Tax=Streptomyces canus TaxID=58343 RepID=UPI00325180AE